MVDKVFFCFDGFWVVGEMKDVLCSVGFVWGFMIVLVMKKEDWYFISFIESVWIFSGVKNKVLVKIFIVWFYFDKVIGLFVKVGVVMFIKIGIKGLLVEVVFFYIVYDELGFKLIIGGFKFVKVVFGIDMKIVLFDLVDFVVSGKLLVKDW